MNLFYLITLYLWDFIFLISNKNKIKILRIVCKDFRNISTNYWIQTIPHKEINNYFISNQKLKFNIRFIILENIQIDIKNLNINDLFFNKSCKYGYLEIVKLLLKNNANINQKDYEGYTPLIYASIYGQLEIVKLLIKYGANINEKNNYNYNALYFACVYGHLEIVKLLLENGVNINEKDYHGYTPLLYVSRYGKIKIVKLLLENGANINEKDSNNKTILQHAKENKQTEIVKYLKTLV